MGAYAILSLPLIEKYASLGNVVIDVVYSWDELLVLQNGFRKFESDCYYI